MLLAHNLPCPVQVATASLHTRGVSCVASPSNTRRSEKSTRRLASKAASSMRASASACRQANSSTHNPKQNGLWHGVGCAEC